MAVELANDDNFKSILDTNDKVVVKFYADWCGSCKLFAPKFKRISNDEKYDKITFINVNAEKSPEARRMVGVTTLPFFATFMNGQLQESVSANKEEVVVEIIEKLN